MIFLQCCDSSFALLAQQLNLHSSWIMSYHCTHAPLHQNQTTNKRICNSSPVHYCDYPNSHLTHHDHNFLIHIAFLFFHPILQEPACSHKCSDLSYNNGSMIYSICLCWDFYNYYFYKYAYFLFIFKCFCAVL